MKTQKLLRKLALRPAMLAPLALLAATVPAAAHADAPARDRLNLSATASVEVPRDVLGVVFSAPSWRRPRRGWDGRGEACTASCGSPAPSPIWTQPLAWLASTWLKPSSTAVRCPTPEMPHPSETQAGAPAASTLASGWFHSLQLPDADPTPGRFDPARPPNYTLFGVFDLLNAIDLRGLSALDIGTMDGLVAFGLKLRGAGQVIATDLAARDTFLSSARHLGLELDYRTGHTVDQMPRRWPELRADLVVMAGVLYHVLDPLGALGACRQLLAPGGLLVVETQFLPHAADAVMRFNPADTSARANRHVNVFWRPSRSALLGMLQLMGFEPLASVRTRSRIAVLARAARPGEMQPATTRLGEIFRNYGADPAYNEGLDFAALESDATLASRIRYRGPFEHWRRWASDPSPDWPLQPRWTLTPAQRWRGRWMERLDDLRGRLA